MSNPAPTLNQINAFNATQGTTIDFNIIGGTEVIRSNKIYIYDLNDNSLICTHLYVSTESIHELPSNTSSSIVYASGKSSADFTNNTQYYAQIQTFTDVGGTQGGSGLSIAKLFWCLPTPTLTLSTIPTTISTTSYNVSATYTPNTSGSATNEVQEFQFNLYSAIGALLQTSGVVLYGDGVDLSYNFSGLEVDSTYYVTLDVTTTQGMNVSAQSNTFTVSIDTPTIGSASVVNNGCDGYISVTSSLSSEYEHEESSEAGEIMSFTTDSVNDIIELDVDFEPVQDGTPWMSAQNTEPYMFRPVPSQTEDFGHESDTIVGGTVAWNQLAQPVNATTKAGTRFDWDSTKNAYVATGVATASYDYLYNTINVVENHKYLSISKVFADPNSVLTGVIIGMNNISNGMVALGGSKITNCNQTKAAGLAIADLATGTDYTGVIFRYMLFDLTQMFGSTIADYIYSLEQATEGAGVAWFRKLFPKPYYAYNAGELMSVNTSAHNTVGFNQWDEEWEVGGYNASTGGTWNTSDRIRSKSTDYIKVVPNTTYCAYSDSWGSGGGKYFSVLFYDADKNYISYSDPNNGATFTTPNNAYFARFALQPSYGTTYKNDICINLHWDGSRNGEYEPYQKWSYPLDSDLELRGIPKLSNGKLYYDGDTYESDGTVTRKYGVVDLGSLSWGYTNYGEGSFYARIPTIKRTSNWATKPNIVCSKYEVGTGNDVSNDNDCDKVVSVSPSVNDVIIKDLSQGTDTTAFKTAMSGVYLVYELATPTTETADPYTNPQIVDPSGTEEYVGSPIPVGHKTTYQRICPITGFTGCEVDVSGVNVWDEEWEDGEIQASTGQNYSNNKYWRTKNYIPILPNTEYYVSSATITTAIAIRGRFYDANKNYIGYAPQSGGTAIARTFVTPSNAYYMRFSPEKAQVASHDISINYPSTDTTYHAYNGTTYPVSWQTEAGTVYGGTVDVVSGVLTVTEYGADMGDMAWSYSSGNGLYAFLNDMVTGKTTAPLICSAYKTSVQLGWGNTQNYEINCNITNGKNTAQVILKDSNYTSASDFKTAMTGQKIVYPLATPQTYQLTPQQMQTLSGQNNVWSNTNGGMYLVYQLPITSLLVKRRDVADISGKWLTLYSTPITQASDMDFTFIDFLNQYGKTYQYALVPVLEQDQSGVIVQIEGGYTVSDNVDSIFDGVYIADQTNVERVKAGAGYGNIDMNQGVGSITPIGSKYPIVITNSQNQYHNGSVRGTIVPNNFYSNGNLSRIDMVNKRDELEQFLTNKRAKIIKDWNGKIWLVMIMSNVSCSFDDNYGMGMVSFSADWLEVGDPTNQQDLYNAGLINVGGV